MAIVNVNIFGFRSAATMAKTLYLHKDVRLDLQFCHVGLLTVIYWSFVASSLKLDMDINWGVGSVCQVYAILTLLECNHKEQAVLSP